MTAGSSWLLSMLFRTLLLRALLFRALPPLLDTAPRELRLESLESLLEILASGTTRQLDTAWSKEAAVRGTMICVQSIGRTLVARRPEGRVR